jgi:DNA polymerase III alpha subunit (gram-positive type)
MAEPLSEQEKALMVAGTRATQLGGSTFSVSLLDPKSRAEYEAYEENIKVQYRTWWYQQSAQHIENQMK